MLQLQLACGMGEWTRPNDLSTKGDVEGNHAHFITGKAEGQTLAYHTLQPPSARSPPSTYLHDFLDHLIRADLGSGIDHVIRFLHLIGRERRNRWQVMDMLT